MNERILEVKDLKKYFPLGGFFSRKKGVVHAVDDVSFSIKRGETLGLVGESGSGKTTVGRAVLRLIEPTEGEINFDGVNLLKLSGKELQKIRKKMGIVFQDPKASLNPRMTVKDILNRPLVIHDFPKGERLKRILDILEKVGLEPGHLGRYPHEFSGGQQQRISIARAIILNPALIVLDEPTSALDMSVQAKILNLLVDLQREFNLTYLFISHDLTVIQYMCDWVAVMYLGKIVELSRKERLFENVKHPYTISLLSAAPIPDPKRRYEEKIILKGEIPSPINPPPGCRFHPRCPQRMEVCEREQPDFTEVEKDHLVTCYLYH
jgi:oligopeptide/dipeptide ABC transporter ATP-binding protein